MRTIGGVWVDEEKAHTHARSHTHTRSLPSSLFLLSQQLGGMDHWNFLRKPASDFGWDWGPAFAPAGIAGGVSLVAHSSGFLSAATVRQGHDAETGDVTLHFDAVLSHLREGETGTLSVRPSAGAGVAAGLAAGLPARSVAVSAATALAATPPLARGLASTDAVVPISLTIPASAVALWWPHGYGRQPLYGFDLAYQPHENEDARAPGGQHAAPPPPPPSTLTRRVGLRTISLIRVPTPARAPGPAPGEASETFHFEVNGVEVFAKGANYIPPHIFHSRAPGLVRGVIAAAAAAHMNMVRVWGGGAYPPSEFYEAADEMGVLVWQEFMAACAFYPRDTPFLEAVTAEVVHQARRFGHHASLALWGGNNELEPAFTWFEAAKAEPRLWAVDYYVLFVETVRAALLAAHAGAPFIDASPTNGVISEDPYVKRWGDSGSPYAGDVHYYNYTADPLDPATYPAARFVSEFGFQSFPSADVAAVATDAGDRTDRGGAMWTWRQRHAGGNAEMEAQVGRTFKVPPRSVGERAPHHPSFPSEPAPQRLFRHWAYLTQAAQALAYDTAISAWRRLRSDPEVRNGGVLYWQLNDIWAGQSWSGLDYAGGAPGATPPWRLLHHFARRFYAPLALSTVQGAHSLTVWAASDVAGGLEGELSVEVVRWGAGRKDGGAGAVLNGTFRLAPLTSAPIYEVPVASLLKAAGVASPAEVVVRVRASARGRAGLGAPRVGAAGWAGGVSTAAAALVPPTPAAAASAGITFPADHHRVGGGGGAAPGAAAAAPSPAPAFSAEAVAYLARPKDASGLAVAPRLRFSGLRHVPGSGGRAAEVTVAADAVAPLVSLASGPGLAGQFSDGGFLLLPWEARTVRFEAAAPFALDALEAGLGGSLSLGDTLVWGGGGKEEERVGGGGRGGGGVLVRPGWDGGRDEF